MGGSISPTNKSFVYPFHRGEGYLTISRGILITRLGVQGGGACPSIKATSLS